MVLRTIASPCRTCCPDKVDEWVIITDLLLQKQLDPAANKIGTRRMLLASQRAKLTVLPFADVKLDAYHKICIVCIHTDIKGWLHFTGKAPASEAMGSPASATDKRKPPLPGGNGGAGDHNLPNY